MQVVKLVRCQKQDARMSLQLPPSELRNVWRSTPACVSRYCSRPTELGRRTFISSEKGNKRNCFGSWSWWLRAGKAGSHHTSPFRSLRFQLDPLGCQDLKVWTLDATSRVVWSSTTPTRQFAINVWQPYFLSSTPFAKCS